MTKINNVRSRAADESEGAAERPSDMIVKQSTQNVTVQDETGRSITVRMPKPLQRLRFIDAMGESSSNRMWSATVAPLMYVGSIDGEPVNVPMTKREIEALFQRLDDHGLEAADQGVQQLLGLVKTEVDEEAAKK
jgi:hypothetical protein